MVATTVINQMYGTAPGLFKVKTNAGDNNISGTRYMTSDQWEGNLTTYPIPIPTNGNGISGSYWVTHCLHCTVGSSTYLKNLRYYQTWTSSPKSDWTLGSGSRGNLQPGLWIGVSSATLIGARLLSQGFLSGQYEQATGVEGVTGYVLSGTHDWYKGCNTPLSGGMVPIDKFMTVGTAICIHSGQFIGASATGRSRCIATQVFVGSGAQAGNKADKTACFVYSEA